MKAILWLDQKVFRALDHILNQKTKFADFLKDFIIFGYQEAKSCLFPVGIFIALAVSPYITIPFLARYDLLLVFGIAFQLFLLKTGLETKKELLVITVFHLVGLMLELYKVNIGAWSYPDEAFTKVFNVPLYSGFMYASVASYLMQAWKNLNVTIKDWPKNWMAISLAILIYVNFFTKHFISDLRIILIPIIFVMFWKTTVFFKVRESAKTRKISLVLGFALIAFFVWIAENIATFFKAWEYQYQSGGWHFVDLQIASSWFLMVIISFIIVGQLKIADKSISTILSKKKS